MKVTVELKKTWARFFAHCAVAIFAAGSVSTFFSPKRDLSLILFGFVGSMAWMGLSSIFASFVSGEIENEL